ncbi:hypothetical protein TSOC_008255 [Tetrabaena socialis]|uniref:Uncharacterized protein n=1 Tax=Tetrabaena socialis TaxID=47790 RepID=A0A2J7ZYZ1_9CHLO|nr:hypothetical protein TSOC_008255 [Tetrabaena socialis]|eukprot:PNH05485.1 hypothetical protein TSOC_008255 [Tetrabaena socialis]
MSSTRQATRRPNQGAQPQQQQPESSSTPRQAEGASRSPQQPTAPARLTREQITSQVAGQHRATFRGRVAFAVRKAFMNLHCETGGPMWETRLEVTLVYITLLAALVLTVLGAYKQIQILIHLHLW